MFTNLVVGLFPILGSLNPYALGFAIISLKAINLGTYNSVSLGKSRSQNVFSPIV